MRLVTYSILGDERVGVYTDLGIIDLKFGCQRYFKGESAEIFSDMLRFLRAGETGMDLARKITERAEKDQEANKRGSPLSCIIFDGFKVKSPVPRPGKIICPAVNYVEHGKESGKAPPPEPYLFGKFANSVIGQHDDVIVPRVSKMPDYEVELAVVMGRRGKHISKERAYDYVAGYTILNDISFRDLQGWPQGHPSYGSHWLLGKSADTACPIGPWIVTKDELESAYPLRIKLSVNGIVRQDSDTSLQVFKIPEIIEFVSKVITLEPGDVISTGTPSGVGRTTMNFLKGGDLIEAEVEKIGVLRNRVVNESPDFSF